MMAKISMYHDTLQVTQEYLLLSDMVETAKRLDAKPRINLFVNDDSQPTGLVLSYTSPHEVGHDDMPPWRLVLRLDHESSGIELKANGINLPLDVENLLGS